MPTTHLHTQKRPAGDRQIKRHAGHQIMKKLREVKQILKWQQPFGNSGSWMVATLRISSWRAEVTRLDYEKEIKSLDCTWFSQHCNKPSVSLRNTQTWQQEMKEWIKIQQYKHHYRYYSICSTAAANVGSIFILFMHNYTLIVTFFLVMFWSLVYPSLCISGLIYILVFLVCAINCFYKYALTKAAESIPTYCRVCRNSDKIAVM